MKGELFTCRFSEFISWEVEYAGVDLVVVDFAGVDLVGGHCYEFEIENKLKFQLNTRV